MTGLDVVIEVEDVRRVVGVLEGGQPRSLLLGVGAAYAGGSLVAEGVHVGAGGERVELCGGASCGAHARRVLGGIGPLGAGDVLEARVTMAKGGRVVIGIGDRPTVGLQADVGSEVVGRIPVQQCADRPIVQVGQVVALPVAAVPVPSHGVVTGLQVQVGPL